jgi:hypothetical protein
MIATCWRLAKAILKKRKPGSSCLEPGVLERLNLEIELVPELQQTGIARCNDLRNLRSRRQKTFPVWIVVDGTYGDLTCLNHSLCRLLSLPCGIVIIHEWFYDA